jgi:ABC-type transport system involved in multi-copper enzyme maturation permease subunit
MQATLRVTLLLAGNTVRELVRSKLLYNLLVFAVLLIGSSMFVAQLTIGQWDRIILDMGLAAIEVSGLLTSVLIGVGLLTNEIDRRTVLPTLAKPVSRAAFLVGRYLGLLSVLVVNVLVMLGVLAGVLHLTGYALAPVAFQAALLLFIELTLLSALAVFFASFSTTMLASGYALSMFLIGHLLSDLKAFGERSHSEVTKAFTHFLYLLLPDLELLNLKAHAASGLAVPWAGVLWAAAYGLAYSLVVLLLSITIFSRRDLR